MYWRSREASYKLCFLLGKYNSAYDKQNIRNKQLYVVLKGQAPPQMSCHMHRGFSVLPHISEQLLHGISSPVRIRYKCSHEKLESLPTGTDPEITLRGLWK